MAQYGLDCRLAMARIKEDRPITQRDDKGNFNVLIGEIVALFITIQGTFMNHSHNLWLGLFTVELNFWPRLTQGLKLSRSMWNFSQIITVILKRTCFEPRDHFWKLWPKNFRSFITWIQSKRWDLSRCVRTRYKYGQNDVMSANNQRIGQSLGSHFETNGC